MSTKLHKGTRYPMSVGAERYSRMLADAVRPVHERLVAEATGRMVHAAVWALLAGKDVRLPGDLDDDVTQRLALGNESDSAMVLAIFLPAVERVLEAAAVHTRRLSPWLSLEFSVSFLADPDGGEWGYAYPFASNNELLSVWASLPGVQDYTYWNNSDAPDDMTVDEWDARGATWDRLLGNDSFAQCGPRYEPPIPSPFILYCTRRRWFTAAAARGFSAAERERVSEHASARTDESRRWVAEFLTRHGRSTTVEDVAASQERDDADLAARFR